jgi:hypothetical protein
MQTGMHRTVLRDRTYGLSLGGKHTYAQGRQGTCSTKVTASRSVCAIFSRTMTTASRRRQKEAVDSFSTCT